MDFIIDVFISFMVKIICDRYFIQDIFTIAAFSIYILIIIYQKYKKKQKN